MKQKNRVLVSKADELLASVSHQQGVAVVNRVPQLEGKHCISLQVELHG